jgi:arylsulfatase A-like enzyme
MMTGRGVLGDDGHHVTFNEDDGKTLDELNGHYVPGMFDVAHDRGLRTALYASKPKFEFLVRSWDRDHGARDRTGADDGRDKLDTATVAATGELLAAMLRRLRTRPAHLTFLHLAAPDGAGHASGFMSATYLDAVVRTDRQVGRVLDTIESTPGLHARTTVVLTADHGGLGPGHEDFTVPADYTIPFYVWGVGARKGADLYRLNPNRLDPGDARPAYDGPQPVRNLDVADLALRLLGLPSVPGTPTHGEGVLVTQ